MEYLKIIIPLILIIKLGEYIFFGWYFDLNIGFFPVAVLIFVMGAIGGLVVGSKGKVKNGQKISKKIVELKKEIKNLKRQK